MKSKKTKVLFIFPSCKRDESNHYPYWIELVDKASKKLDACILFESGNGKPRFHNLKEVSIQKVTTKPLNLIERFWLILKFVKHGYTHIYIHYSYWSLFLAKLISFFKPVKIFYWNCEKYEKKPSDRLLPLALKWCDVLVTGTNGIAEAYRKVFGLANKPISVVPNWVRNFEVSPKRLSKGKTHILFVHHLSPRKGSCELLVIIKETVKINPSAHFHIIGSGSDESFIKHETLNIKHQKNVTFYGSLPLKEVAGFYKAADYFIMPSRSEGFPRVILEAMLYKLPFVSTKVGCVEAIVANEQKPFLVDSRDPAKFVNALIKLIKLKDKSTLIEQNFKQAKQYNKSESTKALISALTS